MEKYIGTKLIGAVPMRLGEAEDLLGRKIGPGNHDGYLVEYEDGYRSWSPKAAFEKAYRRIDGLTFGLALEAIKKGFRAARKGWNAKGMFIYYVAAGAYPAKMDAIKGQFENDLVPYQDYIAMKTASNRVAPWVPAVCDVLGEDWYIV